MSAKKLFISYSHADAALLSVLKTHLRPLERAGLVTPWFDGYLLPGDDIDAKVRVALEHAALIALLVSPDFLASDYCYDIEMQTAVRRHDEGVARVIPIIARESQWHSAPFGRLVAVPTDGKPIMSSRWPDKDEAWTIVAKGIEAAAKEHKASVTPTAPQGVAPPAAVPGIAAMRVATAKSFTDKDRDDFKHSAFDHIARRFEVSIGALQGDLSGSFRRIDANRFTAVVYRRGKKAAGCTLWIGGSTFSGSSICYAGNDSGETNSMNNWLEIEAIDGVLALKPRMVLPQVERERGLDADGAAEFLWGQFVERIR
jgi:TIR domain